MEIYAKNISENILWINCSSNLVMSKGFYAIASAYNFTDAIIQRNIFDLIAAVYKHFIPYRCLFIFEEADVDNKYLKWFFKLSRKSIYTDVLITNVKDYIRGKFIILNFDTYKNHNLQALVKGLSADLRKKYLDSHPQKKPKVKPTTEYIEKRDYNYDEFKNQYTSASVGYNYKKKQINTEEEEEEDEDISATHRNYNSRRKYNRKNKPHIKKNIQEDEYDDKEASKSESYKEDRKSIERTTRKPNRLSFLIRNFEFSDESPEQGRKNYYKKEVDRSGDDENDSKADNQRGKSTKRSKSKKSKKKSKNSKSSKKHQSSESGEHYTKRRKHSKEMDEGDKEKTSKKNNQATYPFKIRLKSRMNFE